jgi:hypothetical protein
MKPKSIIATSFILFFSLLAGGQELPVKQALYEIKWNNRIITEGIVLKWVQTRLFDSDQAIYIVEIDTTAGQFEFGVAAGDKPLITSTYAAGEGVLAAINGTFFNMQEGYNVHYVRVNDSVVAVTDEKEYGIRATGIFTATGEAVDITGWGPESEDAGVITAEDAIVSGPLLTVNGRDVDLDSTNFNKNRHPRSLLGITARSNVLFIAVDGRQPGYADGMSLFELRELARSLGCTSILNLDGGGSTTLYVKGVEAITGPDTLPGKGEQVNTGSATLPGKVEKARIGSAEPQPPGMSSGRGISALPEEGVFPAGVINRPSGKIERPVPSIVFVKKIE